MSNGVADTSSRNEMINIYRSHFRMEILWWRPLYLNSMCIGFPWGSNWQTALFQLMVTINAFMHHKTLRWLLWLFSDNSLMQSGNARANIIQKKDNSHVCSYPEIFSQQEHKLPYAISRHFLGVSICNNYSNTVMSKWNDIIPMTLLNVFSYKKSFVFWFIFNWCLLQAILWLPWCQRSNPEIYG